MYSKYFNFICLTLVCYIFIVNCDVNGRGCHAKFGCIRGEESGASPRETRGVLLSKADKLIRKPSTSLKDTGMEKPNVKYNSSEEPETKLEEGELEIANPVNWTMKSVKVPNIIFGDKGKQGLLNPLTQVLEPIMGLLNRTIGQITQQIDKITGLVNALSTNITMSLNGMSTGLTASINNSTMSLMFSMGEVSRKTAHGVVDVGKTVTKQTVASVSKITDPTYLTGILTNLIKGLLPILGLLFSSFSLLIGMVILLFLSCFLFSRYNAAVKENQGILKNIDTKGFQGPGYQTLKNN